MWSLACSDELWNRVPPDGAGQGVIATDHAESFQLLHKAPAEDRPVTPCLGIGAFIIKMKTGRIHHPIPGLPLAGGSGAV